MPLSGTITAADLNTNFDAQTATILTQAGQGQKDQTIELRLDTLADTDDASARSVAFVVPDDLEDRTIFLRVTDGTAGRVITGTLTVDNGDTTYLVDNTVSLSVTTVNGTVDSRPTSLDLTDNTGTVLRLLSGVRYRLTMANTSAGTTVSGPLILAMQLRSFRREK